MSDLTQEIQDVVDDLEAAWNLADARRFAAPFAPDADFINIRGEHHQGRSAIEQGHRHLFETVYQGSRVQFHLEGLRPLRTDVVIAFLRSHLVYGGPERRLAGDARPSFILTREAGTWRIVSFHNVLLVASPFGDAPGESGRTGDPLAPVRLAQRSSSVARETDERALR
jgi:uncharacterized protein (TIGR02246 family)